MYKIPNTTSKEIAKILKNRLFGNNDVIEYISTDTRENFYNNTCYVALKGSRFNGNEFIDEAIKKKCRLVITDKYINSKIPIIVVNDTKKAFGLLAKAFSQKTNVIGITGSVGKTTVKEMLALVLKEKYSVLSTYKNENNEIGVAKTLLSVENNDYCVVEMGMRSQGEIAWLSYIAQPNISIITNCGTSHLEMLGSEENIFKAKTEIINNTKKYVIIPYEKRFITYSYQNVEPIFIGRDIEYFNVCYYENGLKFSIKYKNITINDIELCTFNINNVHNALFAIVVGVVCGLSNEQIKQGLRKYKGENMHEETTQIKGITIIKDCYNASYESVKGAIFSLKKYAEIKNLTPYLLLGDMLEIGETSQEYHYRIGELAKDLGIKNLFAIGKYAKYLTDGYSGGIICNDKKEMAKIIMNRLNENDVILVKASRALKLEKIVEEMKEIKNE